MWRAWLLLGTVCNLRYRTYAAYGINSRLTLRSDNAILAAHEIGHTFNAVHPNEEDPPIVSCAATIMQLGWDPPKTLTFCQFSPQRNPKSRLNLQLLPGGRGRNHHAEPSFQLYGGSPGSASGPSLLEEHQWGELLWIQHKQKRAGRTMEITCLPVQTKPRVHRWQCGAGKYL